MPFAPRWLLLLLWVACPCLAQTSSSPPVAVDPRLKIELFAEQPAIVTPTGIDVDLAGRVWVLESNTHFPPDQYARHTSDRLYVMRDQDGDGRADQVSVFADGFTHAMSVAARPDVPGRTSAYVASRAAVWLLTDLDGDLRADERRPILKLETEGNYPHNGLAGFAFDAVGWMYVGLGENLGAPYELVGSDGRRLSGGGEGGNVYRLRPDGSQLQLWATGFWNPHASCVDAFGRLFTVDNDADSRPPCRLLHVVEGGDYGYRFRNGRKGLHPFTAWNGELPGTLPMVAGTGEAPSGIVAYESDGLPEDYLGNLLVTSWGDHRLDRYRLEARGVSFTAQAEPFVRGGEDFRPVGLAVAPDGSLYCTDWVKRDYKLHGYGRVWKISAVATREQPVVDVVAVGGERSVARLAELLASGRLEVRRAAARQLAVTAGGREALRATLVNAPPDPTPGGVRERVEALWALELQQSARDAALRGPLDQVATAAQRLVPAGQHEYAADPARIPELLERWNGDATNRAADSNSRPLLDQGLLLAILERTPLPDLESARPYLALDDPFLFAAAVRQLAHGLRADSGASAADPPQYARYEPRVRLGWLLALRSAQPDAVEWLARFLADPDPAIRQAAVQWVAERRLGSLRGQVESLLRSPDVTPDLLLAAIAARQMLDGVPPQDIDKAPPVGFLLEVLRDADRPAATVATALRLLPADAQGLSEKEVERLLRADDRGVRLETVRWLQAAPLAGRAALLRRVAADDGADETLRAEAVVGLANAGRGEQSASRAILVELLNSPSAVLRREALRALRPAATDAQQDSQLKQTLVRLRESAAAAELHEELDLALGRTLPDRSLDMLLEPGDADAGRRLFHHSSGPSCSKCHTVRGRGGAVGPDLTWIARTMDRRKLAQSILQPSREIAPQFTNWSFVLADGKVVSGMILAESVERLRLGTPAGTVVELPRDQIEQSQPQTTSVMPDNLVRQMSLRELRDVLTYLETLR